MEKTIEIDYDLSITEIQDCLEHKEWKEIVEKYKKEYEDGKNSVLLSYLDKDFKEEQIYNFKNVVARQLIIAIELFEIIDKIELTGMKKF
jgi:hypothetical protein